MTNIDMPVFNQFLTLPNFSYKIIMYLVDHNEEIWKILKYDDPDCWKKPNLSRSEKMNLIYDGKGDQGSYRLFMDEGQVDVFKETVCILRIFPVEIFPEDQVRSDVYVGFQTMCHYNINQMSNYQTRCDTILSEIFKTINGKAIDGVGMLSFDRTAFPRCKAGVYGTKPFLGKLATFGVTYSSNVEVYE